MSAIHATVTCGMSHVSVTIHATVTCGLSHVSATAIMPITE